MRTFNAFTGLPRSGSTLVCNILNQNKSILASNTSIVSDAIFGIVDSISMQSETISYIHNNPDFHGHIGNCINSFVDEFYPENLHIFDKGRLWSHMGLQFQTLYPDNHMFVFVRDLRDVFASMEKQHRKNPLFVPKAVVPSNNLRERLGLAMDIQKGMIGQAVIGIMDLVNRDLPNVTFIQYEKFCADPESHIKDIYEKCGFEEFEHNFDNVENTSTDLDCIYFNKFPHNGSGKVSTKYIGKWDEVIDDGSASILLNTFQEYNQHWKYGT